MTNDKNGKQPFHESIVRLMDSLDRPTEGIFMVLCDLIWDTAIPRGHWEILESLDRLARRVGDHGIPTGDDQPPDYVPDYVQETREALRDGMIRAAKAAADKPAPDDQGAT